jgi:hypothetical protein
MHDSLPSGTLAASARLRTATGLGLRCRFPRVCLISQTLPELRSIVSAIKLPETPHPWRVSFRSLNATRTSLCSVLDRLLLQSIPRRPVSLVLHQTLASCHDPP